MKRFFNFILDMVYFCVLGFKYFYIYTHDSFTWLYNQLSAVFGWKLRFYYAQEVPEQEVFSQKIIGWFRWNKNKGAMGTDYQKKYEQAQAQSDRNFKRYKDRKAQSDKNFSLYQSEKKTSEALRTENQKYQQTIQQLEAQLAQAKQTQSSTNNRSQTNDNRSATVVLGLAQGFTQQELKEAHQRLVSRYHPDKHSHMSPQFIQEATDEFKKVQGAYKKLKTGN